MHIFIGMQSRVCCSVLLKSSDYSRKWSIFHFIRIIIWIIIPCVCWYFAFFHGCIYVMFLRICTSYRIWYITKYADPHSGPFGRISPFFSISWSRVEANSLRYAIIVARAAQTEKIRALLTFVARWKKGSNRKR